MPADRERAVRCARCGMLAKDHPLTNCGEWLPAPHGDVVEREEVIKLCEDTREQVSMFPTHQGAHPYESGWRSGVWGCLQAIRALPASLARCGTYPEDVDLPCGVNCPMLACAPKWTEEELARAFTVELWGVYKNFDGGEMAEKLARIALRGPEKEKV